MGARSTQAQQKTIEQHLLFAWRSLHGDPQRSLAHLDSAHQLAESIGHDVRPFAELVRGFFELRFGSLPRAEEHLRTAHRLLDSAQNQHFRLLAGDGLAAVAAFKGGLAEGRERLEAALGVNAGPRLVENLGFIHHWLAVIHRKLGGFEASLDHFHRAVHLARQSGDAGFQALVLGSLGGLQLDLYNRPDALRTLEEGYRLARVLPVRTWLGPNALNLALAYVESGQPARAKEILDRHGDEPQVWTKVPRVYYHFAQGLVSCSLGAWSPAQTHADLMLAALPPESADALFAHARIQGEILLGKNDPAAAWTLCRKLLAEHPEADSSVDLVHLVEIAARSAALQQNHQVAYELSVQVAKRRTTILERSIRAQLETRKLESELSNKELERVRALREAERAESARARLSRLNLRLREQMSEIRSLQTELKRQATTDPLTGMLNRRRFDELVGQAIALSGRNGKPLALVCMDLDHFKRVNDRYGHPAGDEVLKQFAAMLQHRKRRDDRVFRIGGEEFCALLQNCDAAQARKWAMELLEGWRGVALRIESNVLDGMTFSAGVAQCAQARSSTASLLRAADNAMYRAKRAGRNRIETSR